MLTNMLTTATSNPIFEIASGFVAAKRLFSANEIGLLDALAKGPAVVSVVQKRLRSDTGTADVEVVGRDFFADPLPDGPDVAILAGDGDIYSEEEAREWLRNCGWRQSVLSDCVEAA